uniref:Uncharacterized protein n=1 Tax=Megaselia scalaris TaxID=36166 RepID=T1GSU0_MEGSC
MMTSPFGSTNNLTPSTQLAQMKLASCTNINEVSEDDEKPCLQTKDDLLMAPLSTQPSRRTKTLTLNNLRRI